MKGRMRGVRFLLILSIPLAGLFYTFPRHTVVEVPAVEYRLGDPEEYRTLRIGFEGTFQRRFFDKNRFRGNIRIDGQELRDVDVILHSDGALLMFRNPETEKMERFGAFYSNGQLNVLTIAVLEPVIQTGQISEEKFWDMKQGLMISAPAESREEALNRSNELMGHLLEEPLR